MNKLVALNEVRNKKSKNKLSKLNNNGNIKKDCSKSYINFKKKFNCFDYEDEFIDFQNRCNEEFDNNYEKKLNKIMERIFSLNNDKLVIEFINSIYNDDLNINTKIQYIKTRESIDNNQIIILNSLNYNLRILAEDEYKKFEYRIRIQAKDNENIAIMIRKIDLTVKCNIISINKKIRENYNNNKSNSVGNYSRCMIILSSNVEVPDVYEIKSEIEGKYIDSKINIIKSWKYDFNQLSKEKMYLLFPLKTLDFVKRLSNISEDLILRNLIKDEIFRFFKDMNKYLEKGREDNLITNNDINELNLITIDLLNCFIQDIKDVFGDIKKDIEITLKDLVV